MTPKFGVKLGVKVTPEKGVILYLKFLFHFWSYNNFLKIMVYGRISESYNAPALS